MANYTHLEDVHIHEISSLYGFKCTAYRPLKGGMANTSYLLESENSQYVLTILNNHDLRSALTLFEIQLHTYLSGIPTNRPIESLSGKRILEIQGNPVMLKTKLNGQCMDQLPSHFLPASGRMLAKVHALTCAKEGEARRLPADCLDVLEQCQDSDFANWFKSVLSKSNPDELSGPSGFVHGDYFSDNLIVQEDGSIAVIDWECAGVDFFVYDIGMAILGLCRTNNLFDPYKANSLLSGYQAIRKLEDVEWRHLKSATIYAALMIAYHRYVRHHITHPDPGMLHLHNEIRSFVESFEDQWAFTNADSQSHSQKTEQENRPRESMFLQSGAPSIEKAHSEWQRL
jgi:homoserine kinase type II